MKEFISPRETTTASAYEENLWDLYLSECAEEVPCLTLSRFYLLLTASSTRYLLIGCVSNPYGYADFHLFGPITDDVNEHKSEREGCLKARYRLFRREIHQENFGLLADERRTLMEIVKNKRRGTVSTQLLGEALGIPRVK